MAPNTSIKHRRLVVVIVIGVVLTLVTMQLTRADTALANVDKLTLSRLSLVPTAKLGQVTIAYDIVPSSGSFNAVMQLYIDVGGGWQEYTPTDDNGTVVLHLYKDLDCSGTFIINLPKGHYTHYRLILFDAPSGASPDFNHILWDSANQHQLLSPKMDLTVQSSFAPINTPVISFPPNPLEEIEQNGLTTVTIPALVKYPVDYAVEGGGFWAMAKGSGGFAQVWVDPKDATENDGSAVPYMQVPISFVLKDLAPGIFNVAIGLFKSSFGTPIQWVYPGMDFEVGGNLWETRAPLRRVPPRLRVIGGKFEVLSGRPYDFYLNESAGRASVKFVRGGNYGNAITWTTQPELDTPGYFTLLSGIGCHYIRFNYNPDRYLEERVYQDSVDQVVQNIWAAGLYPIVAPQDLPSGDTLNDRIDAGDRLTAMIAKKYLGKSVWIELCNEPHEFNSWAQWKPVAERYLKTVRDIDPNALVIVPFENYSKDGSGAALSPITDEHVDLYDGHAYMNPQDVAVAYGAATKAGLPVIIGEYGGNDGSYLHLMDKALQTLSPPPLAVSPWAFTVKGQDSIPLVEDGSTANLVLTPAGQAISNDFNAWDNGRRVF